jgi:hypothetical protein
VVAWGLEHRTLGPIQAIGVDEIAYAKGHKYLTLVYRRGRPTFSGEIQSSLAMERYQEHPNYYVYAKRWWLQKRYVTDCDPSQGSWLIDGLKHWKHCAPAVRAG